MNSDARMMRPGNAAPTLGLATAAVLLAAGLVLAGSLWRIGVAVPRDAQLNHVSGVWITVAMDLADGIFYRPLLSADGYGGTRYFPLHFVLHGLLIKLGMDPVRSGYVITLASGLGLVAGVYALLRGLGLGRAFSAAAAILVLSTRAAQLAITTIRGDLLPAALDVWGVACAARLMGPAARRRDALWAALFFSLAFMGKETTLFGFVASAAALFFAGRRREAARLSAWTLGLAATFLLASCLFSHGRIISNLLGCASGGVTWNSMLNMPQEICRIFRTDPLGMAFPALVLAMLLRRGCAEWKSLPALWLLVAAAVTLAMIASPGIGYNHVLDVQIAAVVFFAARAGSEESRRPAKICLLALAATLTFLCAFYVHHVYQRRDAQPQRRQLQELFALTHGHSSKPVLADNNVLLAVGGVRAVMLDPFMFRVLSMKNPSFPRRLWKDLETHRFGAVVLGCDPRTPDGEYWLREMDFGPGFAERLLQSYNLSTEKYGCYIFTPRD